MISGSPCSDFQDRIRSVFNEELPEGLKVTEMSPDSLNIPSSTEHHILK